MIQKKQLILAQGLLLLFIFLSFYTIVFIKQGNPFLAQKAKQKIQAYYQEKFEKDNTLIAQELTYDHRHKTYQIAYYDPTYTDRSFTISYRQQKISDTYQQDYVEGKKLLQKRSLTIQKKWQHTLLESNYQNIHITFAKLNEYSLKQQQQLLKNQQLEKSGLYQVSLTLPTKEVNEVIAKERLTDLDVLAHANHLIANKYTLFLKNDHQTLKITKEKEQKINE